MPSTYAGWVYPRLAHFGSLTISTYGVLAAAGLVAAVLFAEWCAPRAGVSAHKVYTLCLATVVGTVLLSRLLLIAQSPRSFRQFPLLLLSLPTVTRFGLLLATGSALVGIAVQRMSLLRTLDAIAPAALVFGTFLHVGSFFAGSDLGSHTALAIGNLVPGDEGHHPVALYAAGLTGIGALLAMLAARKQTRPGMAFGTGLAAAAAGQFVADEFRPTYLLPELRVPGFLRVDQLVLIALTAIGMLLWLDWRRDRA